MIPERSSFPRPSTLSLPQTDRHSYHYWTLHDRLRLRNEKLSRRQQSSCRITFCSLWLFIFSSVTCIVVYRFTDECPETSSGKILFTQCLRYWLLLIAVGITSLACCAVIFGICKYLRAEPRYNPNSALTTKLSLLSIREGQRNEELPSVSVTNLDRISSKPTCLRGVDVWKKQYDFSSSFY